MTMNREFLSLSVGDRIGALKDAGAIFEPDRSAWYALRVQPQREDQAEAWLARRGVYAFHPVLERKVVCRGILRVYDRRYLPGYVFARFPGIPIIHRVMACAFITGALTLQSGAWGVLDRERLAAIHAMRKIDLETKAALQKRRAQRRLLSRGDRVMFRAGPFAEIKGEVIDLAADGGVTVRLVLFAREFDVATSAVDLVPMQKAS